MQRSVINKALRDMEQLIRQQGILLPPFAWFTPEDWQQLGSEYDEIRDTGLGWVVTDFGLGTYAEKGLAVFVLRNGNIHLDKYPKTYAEKLLMLYPGQSLPLHYHKNKTEDLINKGPHDIAVQLYNVSEAGELLSTDVLVRQDGRAYYAKAGAAIMLAPGESVSFESYTAHGVSLGTVESPALMGEISSCNDDRVDNYFLDAGVGAMSIEEDEAPYRLLEGE